MSADVPGLAAGVLGGDRTSLARSITLVESTREEDREASSELLSLLAKAKKTADGEANDAIRLAVSGPPGAGKSTLIEALGSYLLDRGKRVAVLAIDPSSTVTGGSVLADKTRMARLSRDPRAFVRPSPSAATLGGVARRTREAMLVVEAAGFEVVVVETVGVGQSETEAHSLVDTFLLLLSPGGGDEIQGIKRGIVELSHIVAVNKADGESREAAKLQAAEYESALRCLGHRSAGTTSAVSTVSALTGDGIAALWDRVLAHRGALESTGALRETRKAQLRHAARAAIEEELLAAFDRDPEVQRKRATLLLAVETGEVAPDLAARELISAFFRR